MSPADRLSDCRLGPVSRVSVAFGEETDRQTGLISDRLCICVVCMQKDLRAVIIGNAM
jgi:hypothetical protein